MGLFSLEMGFVVSAIENLPLRNAHTPSFLIRFFVFNSLEYLPYLFSILFVDMLSEQQYYSQDNGILQLLSSCSKLCALWSFNSPPRIYELLVNRSLIIDLCFVR